MDNNKEEGGNGREVGRTGVLGWGGGKRQKTVLEQQFKKVITSLKKRRKSKL